MKDLSDSNILIIGGTGLVGSCLCNTLKAKGFENIVVMYSEVIDEKEMVEGFRYEKFSAKSLISEVDLANVVIYLPRPDEELIKLFTDVLKETKNPKKIIYASTALLYEDNDEIHTEDSKVVPMTKYEFDKQKEEEILRNSISDKHTLIITRFSNIYGGSQGKGIINKIFEAAKESKPFEINGDGNIWRDFIHVEDIAMFIYLLTIHESSGIEIFNISTGVSASINELIAQIETISGRKITVINRPAIEEKKYSKISNRKIVEATAHDPQYSLKAGLEKMFHELH